MSSIARNAVRRALTVRPVASREDARAWVDVAFTLNRGNPAWVPPLRREVLNDMDWRKNPFHRHAHTEHFLLRDGPDVVGRVAATVHPAYNERHDRNDVFFGFLEAPADLDCLELLLQACEEFGQRHAATVLAGPYSYWSGAEMGLLTNEFDRPTAVFQPWNRSGLKESLEELGLTARTRLDAFEIDVKELGSTRSSLLRAGEQVTAATGIVTRPLRMRRFREDGEIIRRLNTESFAASSEVLPYPPDV